MNEVKWVKIDQNYEGYIGTIGINDTRGVYTFHLVKRPHYCDRGDWLLMIEYKGDKLASTLDEQDGFPRYFFGSDDEAKEQMQRWANKRQECK
jgi:hypothetical protein